jgi:nucleotide-binding universal stress UspA family protein
VAALRTTFESWAHDTAAGARWSETEGSAPSIIGERGSRADVIVAGQPLEDDRLARQVFSAALFGTDRPVLLIPPGSNAAFGRRVAIAWRDEKCAVKAVIPALRCLAEAEQVHVLMGVRDGTLDPGMPRILLEHAISAELHTLPIGSEPFGQTLLDAVHRLSADLLVMGAYAHSPLRELILGGVTRYMLDHADLPVLMRH